MLACFSPEISEGVACGEEQTCPSEMECDPADNRCRRLPFPVKDAGPADASLDAAECSTHKQCDDELFCNGVEQCAEGRCVAAAAEPSCDDEVDCTTDACSTTTDACTNVPNHDACTDDGASICEATLGCVGQTCTLPAECDDGVFCNGDEQCDLAGGGALGVCRAGTSPTCLDLAACTVDSCDSGLDACTFTPNDGACDDGLFCNGAETCSGVGGANCVAGTAPSTDDGIDCTVDSCSEALDEILNAPNNGFCDDGAFCNGVETCSATADCQAGTPPACGVTDVCDQRSCDEASDVCREVALFYDITWTTYPLVGPNETDTVTLGCGDAVFVDRSENFCSAGVDMAYQCAITEAGLLRAGSLSDPFDFSCLGFGGSAVSTGCSNANASGGSKRIECCF